MGIQDYLPLVWYNAYKSTYNYSKIPIKDLRVLVDDYYAGIRKDMVLRRYANLNNAVIKCMRDTGSQEQILADIDIYSMLKIWSKNKLAYKFDSDFLDELMRTDTISLIKGAWGYLPCELFYIDISDNEELSKELSAKGMFIYLTEGIAKDVWQLHVLRISSIDTCYFECFNIWNRDEEIAIDKYEDCKDLFNQMHKEISDTCDLRDKNFKNDYNADFSGPEPNLKEYYLLIQILTYMSSTEPDIREVESGEKEEKASKVSKVNKVKVDKVKQYKVGAVYGEAFRKWKVEGDSRGDSIGTGKKLRPHYCRAHWHSYWYGKAGEERIKRQKWLHGYFTGSKPVSEDQPVVIHDVK